MHDHMTKLDGVPSKDQVKPGMAHFSGSGPINSICGQCSFFVQFKSEQERGRCQKYQKLTGSEGNLIRRGYAACKYFSR